MNQREIKFRVWDKSDKKIIDAKTIGDQAWNVLASAMWGKGDWEFMQFTGLKDKNGKEIYESDLCIAYGYTWKVAWLEAGFWFINYKKEDIELNQNDMNDFEIIGNIYENPELLK